MQKKVYILTFGIVFLVVTIIFDFFPRSTFSPIEKRALDSVPTFTFERLFSGDYTRDVSHWFSDSEPFRDQLLTFSMALKKAAGITSGDPDEAITFQEVEKDPLPEDDNRTIADYENNVNAAEMAKVAMSGIIIVGSGPNARAIMAYGGGPDGGKCYSDVANLYKKTFGDKVNIYCLTIPTAGEFYCPAKAEGRTKKQLPTIRNINAHLDPEVKAVNIYSALAAHVKEDIYLRTDHHWAPLGAYYAAEQFAKVAGVPFKDLKTGYNRRVIHGYVGSMYGYSKDISIKNAPEDFVYYMPKDSNYTTTIISYRADENFRILGESGPMPAKFFHQFKDGSPGAYCTFMGTDMQLTVVRTGTKNGRRLIILKDSFGNALPGYLFYSFEEIHVVDYRYFNKNLKEYVPANKITDILFAFNVYSAYNPVCCNRLAVYLNQNGKAAPANKASKGEQGHNGKGEADKPKGKGEQSRSGKEKPAKTADTPGDNSSGKAAPAKTDAPPAKTDAAPAKAEAKPVQAEPASNPGGSGE